MHKVKEISADALEKKDNMENKSARGKLNEVFRHCNIRTDAWMLHMVILVSAFLGFTSAVQLSSPAAEVEMPYYAKIMSQTVAMDLWQLTAFVNLTVFLCSLSFKALSKITLWTAGSLISSAIWGAIQFFILLGQASFISASDGNSATSLQAFYIVPLYSLAWLSMMLFMAHMGLVAYRKTDGKYFLTSWHEIPVSAKLVLPGAMIVTVFLQTNAAIEFLLRVL